MPYITVFTPTYNRAYILTQLYDSLKRQTSQDFEWLIVDDGSTDNTKILVDSFMNQRKIDIRYVYQENGGKQRAINRGVGLAKGELFFIVDSDDYLTNDAIESIKAKYSTLTDKKRYAGVCFRRTFINKIKQGGGEKFPYEEFDSDSIRIVTVYGVTCDKAEIFRTHVLHNYPFPEIENENFVPEAYIWLKMAHDGYQLRFFNKPIYCCEYLADGLSKNFKRNMKKNPKGFMLYYMSTILYKEMPVYPYKLKGMVRVLQCLAYRLLSTCRIRKTKV